MTLVLDIPPVAGAFLAGFALAKFPANGVARGLLLTLTDFFQAIFFTTLGTLVVLPEPVLVLKALGLVLVVLIVTPPLVTALAEWQGMTSRPAVESGLLLAQTSEFALVLGIAGSQLLGHITEETFSVITLVAVVTMTLTPFLATDGFTSFVLHFHPLRRRAKKSSQLKDHVVMLGFGAGGMWVLKPLLKEGYQVWVVDDDAAVIEQLQRMKIPCLLGDGSDTNVLASVGARRAKLILASMRRVGEAIRVLRYVRQVPVVVRVFESADAKRVQSLGGIPVLNSIAAADTFMGWFNATMRREATTAAGTSGSGDSEE
jgi:CPA2 family monovalent cation:H+ antiporter-2